MNRPTKIGINIKDRDGQSIAFYIVYRIIRFFNVSIWTYFLPTIALIAQFAIPLFYKGNADEEASEAASEA